MAAVKTIGAILTLIGGVLLAIVGIIQLSGATALASLTGITGLVLGVGLILFSISAIPSCKKQA